MQKTLQMDLPSGYTNAAAAMKTAGWTGYNRLFNSSFINANNEPVYVHVTRDGRAAPVIGDAAKGIPAGNTVVSTEFKWHDIDAGLTWFYVASPVTVKMLAKDF